MIIELYEEVWRNMTDMARDALIGKKDVRIRLFGLTVTKRGMKQVRVRFI